MLRTIERLLQYYNAKLWSTLWSTLCSFELIYQTIAPTAWQNDSIFPTKSPVSASDVNGLWFRQWSLWWYKLHYKVVNHRVLTVCGVVYIRPRRPWLWYSIFILLLRVGVSRLDSIHLILRATDWNTSTSTNTSMHASGLLGTISLFITDKQTLQ